MRRLYPALLPGFARSKGSITRGVRRGAEQQGAATRLCVQARRCRRRDHRASTTYRQRTPLLWPSITRATTDQLADDAGKLSTPAQVQCPVSPTRHRSSADTKTRLLSRIEFGYHHPEPTITVASHTPAATHPNSHTETDPQICQESHLCAASSVQPGVRGLGGWSRQVIIRTASAMRQPVDRVRLHPDLKGVGGKHWTSVAPFTHTPPKIAPSERPRESRRGGKK